VALTPDVEKRWKDDYSAIRQKARESGGGDVYFQNPRPMGEYSVQERGEILEQRWQDGGFNYLGSFNDFVTNAESNGVAAAFIHDKIRQRVDNPAVAELLCPKHHPFATKRPCVDTDYYETYNRNNVSLVDISGDPIDEITPKGLRIGATDYALDALVFATGFDAMTGALTAVRMTGRDGIVLKEKWRGGPRNYLGIAVAGFPNMYTITGPGSPSVLTNMLVSIEQHVDWVVDCMVHLRDHDLATVEPTVDAEDKWVDLVNANAEATLYPLANSWYMGANIPGKPRVFTPYVGHAGHYRKTCDEVAAKGYEGFTLS
jgi:cyclohexanone monooxygenase